MKVTLPGTFARWFEARGWRPHQHQLALLAAAPAGRSALPVAPTGGGKTLAGFLPSLSDLETTPRDGLHTLYVSPLKALTVDIHRNLEGPVAETGLDVRIETRTGDTPSHKRDRQRRKPPHILLTTPESLALMLSYPEAGAMFGRLACVVVDELHAVAQSKRGDQLALCLARLSTLAPGCRRVGLSATIADRETMRAWLSPSAGRDPHDVELLLGRSGAAPDIGILVPGARIPWEVGR